MISPEEFTALRERLGSMERDKAQAEGALAELRKRLKQEFGASTKAEAETLLKKWRKELDRLESEFREGLENLDDARDA